MKTSKYEKNYWLTVALKNTSEVLKDLISFIALNVEILEHVYQKIDKHTLAFESNHFKDDFKKMYDKDSEMKHLIEHPAILRSYYLMKFILEKLKLMIHS